MICNACKEFNHGRCVNMVSFPRCTCEHKTYIYWYTHRNGNDGRRDSAIGNNKSKIHLQWGQLTLCGIDIASLKAWGQYTSENLKDIKDNRSMCKKCDALKF